MARDTRKPKKRGPDAVIDQVEGLFDAVQRDRETRPDERVRLVQREDAGHPLLIYATPKGVQVDLAFRGGTLWATQVQMVDMFGVDLSGISRHLKNIYDEGELQRGGTVAKIARVANEGNRQVTRSVEVYSLNAIISVGYRVGSKQGTMFRIWSTERLVQILTKGFFVDKERLMNQGELDALDEFRDIARQVRTSIRNSYREVLRLCSLCSDYDGSSSTAHEFFMAMENKLLWAAASKTAPQLILERANAEARDMGLTYYAGKRGPTLRDVGIGNNYLAPGEQERKGRATEMWLTYVEEQLDQGRLPTMTAVSEKLDGFIKFNQWPLLTGKGRHSREAADAHAREQHELHRERMKAEAEANKITKDDR